MEQPIDLVTDGPVQLTPKGAAILADVIRRAVADQQHRTDPPAVECRFASQS